MTKLGLFKQVRRPALIASSAILISFLVFGIAGLRINASPSLPIGLYRVTSDRQAPLVEFCPAEPYASLAAVRGYRGHGSCPDGAEPLMKPIIATRGDRVALSTDGIAVNGVLLPNTSPMRSDTRGRAMTAWAFGTYTLAPQTAWVASTYNPRSFDSRYFGPIRMVDIRCHLKPLIVLH